MKFEVEFGHSNTRARLLEREVFIISMFVILFYSKILDGIISKLLYRFIFKNFIWLVGLFINILNINEGMLK